MINSTDNITELLNIHDLYWKGKSATEIFLIIVPLFLILLILFGYLISRNKNKGKILPQGISTTAGAILLSFFMIGLFNTTASAMCPVCTIAIGAGLGVSRLLGIDDFITSIWMGGLVVSTVNWILSWLEKRKIKSSKATIITYIVMYLLVFIPLQIAGTIGIKGNIIFGVDKVLLGICVGTVFFIMGMLVNIYLRKKKNSVNYIPFQKVVFPIFFLWIASLMAYYIIYYLI